MANIKKEGWLINTKATRLGYCDPTTGELLKCDTSMSQADIDEWNGVTSTDTSTANTDNDTTPTTTVDEEEDVVVVVVEEADTSTANTDTTPPPTVDEEEEEETPDLHAMSKREIITYTLEKFGVELDKKETKNNMILAINELKNKEVS